MKASKQEGGFKQIGAFIKDIAMINLNELEVIFKFTDGHGEELAMVTIQDESLSLRGFRVMKSKYRNRRGENYRILPPCFGKKFHLAVFFKDKDFWYQVEDKIWEAWDRELVDKTIEEINSNY